jgi:hypothetical protein
MERVTFTQFFAEEKVCDTEQGLDFEGTGNAAEEI